MLAACPTCKAVFRGGFQRCPNDGTRLDPEGGDPLVGSVLAGRYQIEGVIGDGGIGRVYRARHVRMSRRFAIKVPFGELGYDRKARARFANEAEAASRLSHPNVIGVVDVGETAEGLFYMAMDLAEGSSLADVIGDGPMVPSRVLAILIQLADGLAHAHDRGLVHRDLKPENVILTRGGDGTQLVRIVDFGLALVDTLENKPRDRLTTEGVVLGTPHYMAPEQATDDQLDFRVDLFALGIIVFEMLAGVHPFDGGPMDVARQNLSRELPSILDRSGIRVDPLLEALVSWLTRKAPAQRPGHAGLVAQFSRHLAAGHRGAAHAMLPAFVIKADLAPFAEISDGADDDLAIPVAPATAEGTGGVSFPPPVSSGAVAAVVAESQAAAKHSEVPVLPRVAEVRPQTTERVEPEPSSARRWIVVGIVLALLGGVLAAALVLGGKRSGGGGAADAALLALADDAAAAPDAAPLVVDDVDATAMLDEPVDAGAVDGRAGRRVDAAITVRPPVDAAVAVRPPVDAAVAVRPPIDAPVPDVPAATLKGLYSQVGQALEAAMTKHGRDRTQALRDRYARIPPYLEAVRKPELRTQAETQLKALLRDLAALK